MSEITGPEEIDWAAAWRRKVIAEREQIESLPDRAEPVGDFWSAAAEQFRSDPFRTEDVPLNRVLALVEPGWTCLDVGAGGGRFALPLALRGGCKVTAVEPSESMRRALAAEIEQYGAQNIEVVPADWMSAQVEAADLVLCSHVLYNIEEITPFIRKLSDHARRYCVVLIGASPPGGIRNDLWPLFRGQRRLEPPVYWDLINVLLQMGIYPDVEIVATERRMRYRSLEDAVAAMRWMLWFAPDPERDERLSQYVRANSEEREDGLYLQPPRLWRQALLRWSPG